jgi:hypothetical protein
MKDRHPIEIRPGASTDAEIEKERVEEERLARMSPDERAKAERNSIAENLQSMARGKPYSETLLIDPDGQLNRGHRLDGLPPYIMTLGIGDSLRTESDLYQVMQTLTQEHPNLAVAFDVDPERKWIKYEVSRKP